MDLALELRNYLEENVLYVGEGFEFDNDSSFIGEGLVDSMGIMELVTHVQGRFGITVEQHEVTPENFDSINRMVAFIRGKQTSQKDHGAKEKYAAAGRAAEPSAAPPQ